MFNNLLYWLKGECNVSLQKLMTIKTYLVRSTVAVDNVRHFEKWFPLKECGFRERDSKDCQSQKRFWDNYRERD